MCVYHCSVPVCSVWVNVDFHFHSSGSFKISHFSLVCFYILLLVNYFFITRCHVDIMIGMAILMTKSPNKTRIRAFIPVISSLE